jgi:putative nucleotidyltransferase with HDIG domain
MLVMEKADLICKHCGAPIQGQSYIEKEAGLYLGEECYFRDTYLDGIVNEIEATYLATIEAFVSAIDAKEHEVGNHSLRVTQFAVMIGNKYGIQGRDLVDLYCGALLHDIGKIGIPDAVLLKNGPLNAEEQAIMHGHPEIGNRIISHIGYLSKAAEIIRAHHEHFDGTGYPRGLRGDEIPAGARVFAVSDTLDALTVKRPYREAVSYEEAKRDILAASGKLFDPSVIDAFMKASDELKDVIGKIIL